MQNFLIKRTRKKRYTAYNDSKRNNRNSINNIRFVFVEMHPSEILPMHIYQHFDYRGGTREAKMEVLLLSHICTKAVEWGYINRHPFKGEVILPDNKQRSRYVEDWEIQECLNFDANKIIKAYIRLAILTGLRKKDLLTLKAENMKEDGIHITTSKTGKRIVIKWNDLLRQEIENTFKLRPVDISPWLFCTRKGECYYNQDKAHSYGFNSIWQRFLTSAVKNTQLQERFTLHDLRAKCASDIADEKHVQRLLAHSNIGITRKAYRRKPEEVEANTIVHSLIYSTEDKND